MPAINGAAIAAGANIGAKSHMNPALLVAGGIGVLGLGFLAFHHGGDKPGGADPSSKDPASGVTPNALPTSATAPGTPGAAGPATPSPSPGPAPTTPGASTLTGTTSAPQGALQGQQVGPYTIVDDQGTQVVIETATQTPVGVLDAEGNLHELTKDAQGNTVVSPTASTGATSGSATSAPTTGAGQAGSVGAGVGTGAGVGAGVGAGASRQVGPYTVVDQGGTQVVYETATQQPVGTLDAQGNLQELAGGTGTTGTPTTGVDAGTTVGGGTRNPTYVRLAASLFEEAPVANASSGAAQLTGSAQGMGASQPAGAAQQSGAPSLGAETAGTGQLLPQGAAQGNVAA